MTLTAFDRYCPDRNATLLMIVFGVAIYAVFGFRDSYSMDIMYTVLFCCGYDAVVSLLLRTFKDLLLLDLNVSSSFILVLLIKVSGITP